MIATLTQSTGGTLTNRRTAWQQLSGRLVRNEDGRPMTSGELIEAAGLNWQVSKEKLQLASNGREVRGAFGLVRQDTGNVLSVVGSDYQPLQNSKAFSFLDSLLMDGIMKYEAALTIKGGQCLALIARLPSVDEIAPGDMQQRYLLLTNWHGGGSIGITPISFRVWCANQTTLVMEAGRRASCKLKHCGDLDAKLTMARRALARIDRAFTQYTDDARRLVVGHTREQAADYIRELYPVADNATERVRRATERRIAQVREAWLSPAQRADGVRGTWWGLYNAVTEAIDHARPARQSRNVTERLENRFVATTTGEGAEFKTRAFELAIAMSA